jgi:hypothetical protein
MSAGRLDKAVRRYRDEMDSQYRSLFDRLHRLIVAMCPDLIHAALLA